MSHLVVWLATEVDPGKKNSKYVFILPPVQSTCLKVLVAQCFVITGKFQQEKTQQLLCVLGADSK